MGRPKLTEAERYALMRRYMKAYTVANSKSPDFLITYECGWVVARPFPSGGMSAWKKRAAEVEGMCLELEARAGRLALKDGA